jgi:hypothetical protein
LFVADKEKLEKLKQGHAKKMELVIRSVDFPKIVAAVQIQV